eukprot:COSAG02_NODE_3591_length_6516_cov_4.904161_7_plen_110_part_00
MCCSFHEEAGGEILNDHYLKHLTSGHPTLPIADLWKRVGIDFSSSEPLNVHFSIQNWAFSLKKTQQSTAVGRARSRTRAISAVARPDAPAYSSTESRCTHTHTRATQSL